MPLALTERPGTPPNGFSQTSAKMAWPGPTENYNPENHRLNTVGFTVGIPIPIDGREPKSYDIQPLVTPDGISVAEHHLATHTYAAALALKGVVRATKQTTLTVRFSKREFFDDSADYSGYETPPTPYVPLITTSFLHDIQIPEGESFINEITDTMEPGTTHVTTVETYYEIALFGEDGEFESFVYDVGTTNREKRFYKKDIRVYTDTSHLIELYLKLGFEAPPPQKIIVGDWGQILGEDEAPGGLRARKITTTTQDNVLANFVTIEHGGGLYLRDFSIRSIMNESDIIEKRTAIYNELLLIKKSTEYKEKEAAAKDGPDPFTPLTIWRGDSFKLGGDPRVAGTGIRAVPDYNLPEGLTAAGLIGVLESLFFVRFEHDAATNKMKIVPLQKALDSLRTTTVPLVKEKHSYVRPNIYNSENTVGLQAVAPHVPNTHVFYNPFYDAPDTKEFLAVDTFCAHPSYFLLFLKRHDRMYKITSLDIYQQDGTRKETGPALLPAWGGWLDPYWIYQKYKKLIDGTAGGRTVVLEAYLEDTQFQTLLKRPVFWCPPLNKYYLALSVAGWGGIGTCKIQAIEYGKKQEHIRRGHQDKSGH